MDPFIESDYWQDFHHSLTAQIKRQLVPQLPAYYQLSAELLVRENDDAITGEKVSPIRPDVGIVQGASRRTFSEYQDEGDTLTAPSRSSLMSVPKQREIRIRDGRNRRLVTAIEVLSPSNKRLPGSATHATKLRTYWSGSVNTVDIDLLRGGHYPYGNEELQLWSEDGPTTPYRIVSVIPEGRSSVWDIELTDRLPTIPIPLISSDDPIVLNLQRAFEEVYTYSTFPERRMEDLDGLRPPLREEERAALQEYL